jgi:hypothetical protein
MEELLKYISSNPFFYLSIFRNPADPAVIFIQLTNIETYLHSQACIPAPIPATEPIDVQQIDDKLKKLVNVMVDKRNSTLTRTLT